jgi:hypothetical protein
MNKEMQAWYMQTFGAKEQASANPARSSARSCRACC